MEKIRKKVLNKEKRKTTVKGKEQEYKGKKGKEEDRREKQRRWKKDSGNIGIRVKSVIYNRINISHCLTQYLT